MLPNQILNLYMYVFVFILKANVAGASEEAGMIPDCWSREQWRGWKERNPWLYCKNGKLGCVPCREAKTLLLSAKGPGMHYAPEWVNAEVGSSCRKALSKKIYKHKDSDSHLRAVEIEGQRQKDILPTNVVAINAQFVKETVSAFRTAYVVAKERLAFRKMPSLMMLQELNGAEVGPVHRSDQSCAQIVQHIATEMKKKIVRRIKERNTHISVTIDESTLFGLAYMIIYIRGDATGDGDVDNIFIDLVELTKGTDARCIYEALRKTLRAAGFDDDYLQRHLISVATDGASVLTGSKSGVISRLKSEFPKLRFVHCLAHRLELAVSDSLKAVSGCNHFEIFISKLYSLLNQSHKTVRLLSEAAAELNIELLRIGQIFNIRWVASSFRTVRAVWRNYPALAQLFKTESEDVTQPDRIRKKYLGLLKYLTSAHFLNDLACMKDVLRELQSLSLKLQRREASVLDCFCLTKQTAEILTAMKMQGGKSSAKAEQCISAGLFKGVSLSGEGAGKINRQQFVQAVVDNLNSCMPRDDLVKMLQPLDRSTWPQNREDLVLYAEAEVSMFAKLLGESSREAVEDFRDYKLNGKQEGETHKRLLIASKTYLATSAECERGFSAMNDTVGKARNKLRANSLAALLFIDLNGPPLDELDLAPFVESWVKAGHRLSTSWVPGRKGKECQPRPVWSIFST